MPPISPRPPRQQVTHQTPMIPDIYVETDSDDSSSSDYQVGDNSDDDDIELTCCAPIQNEDIALHRVAKLRQQRLARPRRERPPNPYLTPAQANARHVTKQKDPARQLKQQKLSIYAPPALDPNIAFGDSSLIKPNPRDFRVYLINPNGLPATDDFAAVHNLCHMADGAEIDALLMPETNTKFRSSVARSLIYQQARKVWPHLKMECASAETTKDKLYQPGGCVSIINGSWATRISDSYQDGSGLGRWTTNILQGKESRKVAIITAYRVCQEAAGISGHNTAAKQQ
jgi:hypothetical protein